MRKRRDETVEKCSSAVPPLILRRRPLEYTLVCEASVYEISTTDYDACSCMVASVGVVTDWHCICTTPWQSLVSSTRVSGRTVHPVWWRTFPSRQSRCAIRCTFTVWYLPCFRHRIYRSGTKGNVLEEWSLCCVFSGQSDVLFLMEISSLFISSSFDAQ